MKYITKIFDIRPVTHDVKQFRLEKPPGYAFIPGQATSVAINKENLLNETRPFTFTSLNSDPYLEFIIKEYPEHHGITEKIHKLQVEDELAIEDPWGTISYGDQGVFVAGGAGITPFIAILRQLQKDGKIADNRLFFSNKTSQDIIKEDELRGILPPGNSVFLLTREEKSGYHFGRMDQDFLEKHVEDFDQNFYVCGPKAMNADIKQILIDMGATPQSLIFEK
jgi:ferredoxin-NADP reductase